MIVFSRVPEPSSLLWCQGLDFAANALYCQCRADSLRSQPAIAESLWQRAQTLAKKEEPMGGAVSLICLAEFFRECDRLGPALECVQLAEKVLGEWPQRKQRQNHAVALYASGLICQLLGSYTLAADYYNKALAEFEEAAAQWPSMKVPAELQVKCVDAQRIIHDLFQHVSRSAVCGDSGAARFCRFMGYWLAAADPIEEPSPEISVSVEEITISMKIHHAGKEYSLAGLGGSSTLALKANWEKRYFVVKLPDEIAQAPNQIAAPPQLKDAGYVLVEADLGENQFGVGTERVNLDRLVWGKFVRDAQGRIHLKGLYENGVLRPPIYIAEDELDDQESGSVIGTFK